MKFTKNILILAILFHFNLTAQIDPGGKEIALSHSSLALSDNVLSLFSNPAGIGQLNWREIGIYYSPAPFGMKELSNSFASYVEPTELGNFSVGFSSYGFSLYKESSFIINYSNIIFNYFLIGINFRYKDLRIKNYGNDSAILIDIGGIYVLSKKYRFGFAIKNISRSTIGNTEDQLPVSFSSGITYSPIPKISINMALYKEISYSSSFSAGLGINYSVFELSYGMFTHSDLGLTHLAGLLIHFGETIPRYERINNYIFGKKWKR